jgi:predicted neutral ceramidase superfamily lipid hydrolase
MIHSLLIIPVLGALKNYVKYKRVSFLLFMRTPILYLIFYSYLWLLKYKNKVSLTIINERVFMFLYKIFYSLLTDSYHKNKLKYIKKYNILYNSRECLEDLTD